MISIPKRFSLYLVVVVLFVVTNVGARDTIDMEEWNNQSKLIETVHRTLFSFGDIVDTITGGDGGGGDGNSISSFSDVCTVLTNGSTGDADLDAVEECTCDSTLISMSSKCITTKNYCSKDSQQQQKKKVCFEKDGSFEMGISFTSSSAKSCVTLAEGTTTSSKDLIGKEMCLSMDLDLGDMMNSNNNESSNQVSSLQSPS